MTAALGSTLVAVVLAALGLAAAVLLTVVPWTVAVDLAERRGLGTGRWGLAAGLCCLLGLAVAALAVKAGALPVSAVGLAVSWAGPLAVLLVGQAGPLWAGTRGRHE